MTSEIGRWDHLVEPVAIALHGHGIDEATHLETLMTEQWVDLSTCRKDAFREAATMIVYFIAPLIQEECGVLRR